MLHTGTMFAVIVYFWPQWRSAYLQSVSAFRQFARLVVIATAVTAAIGIALMEIIAKSALSGAPAADVEELFDHLELIAPALAAAGLLILIAGVRERRHPAPLVPNVRDVNLTQAALIGAIQGLCLPFRGFSRSGATISTGMLLGVAKARAEAFSFALAVVLTPPVVARETMRLIASSRVHGATGLGAIAAQSLLGAAIAFLAGLLALKWLSRWLEGGRWYLFGIYCLVSAIAVTVLHRAGY
jgi:undecaprenyl-diphosphatase